MLRAVLLIAVCAVVRTSIVPALADAPGNTGAFVSYCRTNSEECSDKIAEIYATMLINSTISAGQAKAPKWCPAKEATDMKVLTPKVTGWLSTHPEANSKTTNDGIEMAIIQLYPCKS